MRRLEDGTTQGVLAAIGAVGCGLLYLALTRAPPSLMLINLVAFAIGLVLLVLVRKLTKIGRPWGGTLLVSLSLALVATTLGGIAVEGATRWIRIGGLAVQPSLVLVPVLVTAYAHRPGKITGTALAISVLAIAAQPDRSVAAMLFAGAAAVACFSRTSANISVAALAAAGLGWTLLQPDRLPAMPYVDQILYTAWSGHPLAGLAVWIGVACLLSPALLAWRSGRHVVAATFAAVWGAAVGSAALGNYPTPLVGYGGSAIVGYLLSLLALGARKDAKVEGPALSCDDASREDHTELKFA